MAQEVKTAKKVGVPPRWFVRTAWYVHRAIVGITRGRLGLWRPKPGKWGALRLTTIGRRSGQERSVILGYFEDGENLVTMAMNGWGEGDPAWWLNLQANPAATVEMAGRRRAVEGRAASGEEASRLWERWREIDEGLDSYADQRSTPTPVVILSPIDR